MAPEKHDAGGQFLDAEKKQKLIKSQNRNVFKLDKKNDTNNA
jgi:hypothetical protein